MRTMLLAAALLLAGCQDLDGFLFSGEKLKAYKLPGNDIPAELIEALSLDSGGKTLADERQDLAAVLQNLSVALTQVKSFVADNRDLLSSNIKELNQVSKVLVKNRSALDEVLKDAPVALNNLFLAYDEKAGTLDTRANVGETFSKLTATPSVVLCALMPDACGPLTSVVKILGLKRAGALAPDGSLRSSVVEPVDPTLGGLVRSSR
jgi:hypothetical protein